jgi:hypothetical protein
LFSPALRSARALCSRLSTMDWKEKLGNSFPCAYYCGALRTPSVTAHYEPFLAC